MKVLVETTKWDVEYRQPNHTYLMDGDKAVAYRKWHESEPKFFSKPMRIDTRYRKFEEQPYVKQDWGVALMPQSNIRIVNGSKGNTYEVNDDAGTCTCTGFKFRGHCKHLGVDKTTF